MSPKTRSLTRTAAVTAIIAGGVYVATQITPRTAPANVDPYGTDYQQYIGRQTIPVTVTRYEFSPTHPDFSLTPDDGSGRYVNITAPQLDADLKPVFQSTGSKVITDWTDAQGNPIAPPNPYSSPMPGDQPGLLSSAPGGAVTSAGTFDQWFNAKPGVNQWSDSTMNFEMQPDGTYLLETSLGDPAGSAAHTAEFGWGFVYEAGRDSYLAIETGAEAWVFIDGKLVIDGGGLGEFVDFDIVDDVVIPNEPFNAEVTIVGTAFENLPITTMLRIGSDEFEPWGSLDDPSDGNIDDGNNPRFFAAPNTYAPGTPVSTVAKSWTGFSTSKHRMTVDSADNSQQVYVLRDGDPVPDIAPYKDQASAATFLAPYIDTDTGLITLASNQIIYLYELWTTNPNDATADYQDIVELVTLSAPGASNSGSKKGSGSAVAPAPRLTQTIDLSRLDWLQNNHPYRVQVFYANRTGGASDLRIETNLRTLNVLNWPKYEGRD